MNKELTTAESPHKNRQLLLAKYSPYIMLLFIISLATLCFNVSIQCRDLHIQPFSCHVLAFVIIYHVFASFSLVIIWLKALLMTDFFSNVLAFCFI